MSRSLRYRQVVRAGHRASPAGVVRTVEKCGFHGGSFCREVPVIQKRARPQTIVANPALPPPDGPAPVGRPRVPTSAATLAGRLRSALPAPRP